MLKTNFIHVPDSLSNDKAATVLQDKKKKVTLTPLPLLQEFSF